MEHLAARGIPCPTPIYGRDGRALRSLAGRPAAIVTFLRGMAHKRLSPNDCAELGAALAGLHQAGADFTLQRKNALAVAGWRKLLSDAAPRADEVMPGLAAELEGEFVHLQKAWPQDLPQGVIHADLFPDNVLFLNGRISGLIDFYFACNDFLAYDLAICLNAWCFEIDRSFNVTKARALLSAYRRIRPMSEAELQALPLLAQGSALRFLLTRLYDWLHTPVGALVKPKDPLEYLHKIRFHRNVADIGAYGLR
jgi:homoserine kinase type II